MTRRVVKRTSEPTDALFDVAVWEPALERYGAVVRLSVALYGADAKLVCGPMPPTPIASIFRQHGYEPGVFAECARACLAQPKHNRPPVLISEPTGLAAVGVSLLLNGRIVGAVVGGYALVVSCESHAAERFAETSGTPFQELWPVMRSQPPVPAQRLVQDGELLQVLADTLLQENDLRRHSEEAARQFSHLASHDALTNLPNRMLLADRLARALASARRHHRRMAVLFVDLDRFKRVNDSLGHQLGDELLRLVARDLTTCVRNADTVSRIGGDEFVVVLAELERAEDAGVVARKIIATVARPHTLLGHEVRVTASIGVCVFQGDDGDAETLIRRADMALYDAKDHGRGCHRFYHAALRHRSAERRTWDVRPHNTRNQ